MRVSRLFPFCLAFILLLSCNETYVDPSASEVIDIDPATYLETYVQNKIIFQKTLINENSNVVNGLFITKNGEVHSFTTEQDRETFDKKLVNKSYIEHIYSQSTGVVGQVDLNGLLQGYKWNLTAGRTETVTDENTEQVQSSIRYSSYVLATTYTTWADTERECPVFHDPFANTTRYLNVVLKQEGRLKSVNPGRFIAAIVDWVEKEFEPYTIEGESE